MPQVRNIQGETLPLDQFRSKFIDIYPEAKSMNDLDFAKFASTSPKFKRQDGTQMVTFIDDDPPSTKKQESTGEWALRLASNAPRSLMENTVGAIGNLGMAGIALGGAGVEAAVDLFSGEEGRKRLSERFNKIDWSSVPKAIWDDYAKYYGDFSNNFAEDPFRALGDISMLLSGGAGAVLKAGKIAGTASKAAKIASNMRKASDAIDPLIATSRGIAKVAVDKGNVFNKAARQENEVNALLSSFGIDHRVMRQDDKLRAAKSILAPRGEEPYTVTSKSLDRGRSTISKIETERPRYIDIAGVRDTEVGPQLVHDAAAGVWKDKYDQGLRVGDPKKVEQAIRGVAENMTDPTPIGVRPNAAVMDKIGRYTEIEGGPELRLFGPDISADEAKKIFGFTDKKGNVHPPVDVVDPITGKPVRADSLITKQAPTGQPYIDERLAKMPDDTYRLAPNTQDARKINIDELDKMRKTVNLEAADLYSAIDKLEPELRLASKAKLYTSRAIGDAARDTINTVVNAGLDAKGLPELKDKWKALGLTEAETINVIEQIESLIGKYKGITPYETRMGGEVMQRATQGVIPFGPLFITLETWLRNHGVMSKLVANRINKNILGSSLPPGTKATMMDKVKNLYNVSEKLENSWKTRRITSGGRVSNALMTEPPPEEDKDINPFKP